MVEQVASPERCIAAIAPYGADAWLAGANFGARLSDFGEAARNSGALYRWRHAFAAKTVQPAKGPAAGVMNET
jgi:hypothetical protein